MGFMEEMDMQRPSREAGLYLPPLRRKPVCPTSAQREAASRETMQEEAANPPNPDPSRSRGLRSSRGWS